MFYIIILHCLITTFQIGLFDKNIPVERQVYMNFLTQEAKNINIVTRLMGYQHGRPLDVSLDENRLNRNFKPIYQ